MENKHGNNQIPVEMHDISISVDLQPALECSCSRMYHRLIDIRNKQGKDIEVTFDSFVLQTIAVGNGHKGMSVTDIINQSALKGLIEADKFFGELEAELGIV